MFEDAACNNPCGAEPMGCITCDEIGRGPVYEPGWDDMDDSWRDIGPECPECDGLNMESEDGVNWRCCDCGWGFEDE